MRVVLTLAVLLMACHTLVCEHQAGVELDQEIQRLRTTLEIQQTELRDIEQRAIFARKEVNATSQQLEYLIGIRNSQLHKLRLEPYIIAPNSEMPMYADCIYIGLSAVFCAPTDGTARDPSLPLQATECEEVMLHVLERSPKRSSSNFSAIERVRMTIELNFTFDYGAPPWNGVSEINAHLCVVMPTKQHKHYQAALQAIAGNLRCGHEVFDPARPWSSSYVMPFGEYRMRPADGFKGTFTLNISFQVQDGTVQLRPLLAGATSQRVLACAVTQTPNLCDRESVNVGHLSSPLLPAVEHSERWHFKAPASSAVMQSAPPTTAATTSNSCFVAIVWTFWGEPPPYEMDWLSEVVDSSGCEAAHLLDLQMLCRGSLFSDSYVAEKFGSQYNTASKVFVVSYFSKDFARGFGLMESCMLSWHLDGFDPVLVHFGDDSNSYEYLRYPRLHFVIRNHPTNTTYGDETFQNILHLGIGYKIGFWPSTLRNISLRQVDCTLALRARVSTMCSVMRARLRHCAGTFLSTTRLLRLANFLSPLRVNLAPNLKIAQNGCGSLAAAVPAAIDRLCSWKLHNSTILPAWAPKSKQAHVINFFPRMKCQLHVPPHAHGQRLGALPCRIRPP